MQRKRRENRGWPFLGGALLLFLAGCVSPVQLEPAIGNSEGMAGTAAAGERAPLVVSVTSTAQVQGPVVSPSLRPTTSAPATASPQPGEAPEAVAKMTASAEGATEAQPTATTEATSTPEGEGIPDTTTQTDVEIMLGDDRYTRLRVMTLEWNTNWNKHTVPYDEILSGGPPRDGIPSIDDPVFIPIEEASEWLADVEPVIFLEIDGDARAYPLQILTWHEIANDVVADVPVVITFCPLCNSALVFDRRVNGEIFEFGVSGLLRNSDLIMYDRTTETLWQQFTGDAIVGNLVGRRLRFLPSSIVSFEDFRTARPDGLVLSRETGFQRRYGLNPYAGYDTIGQNPFLFQGVADERLPAMERVVTVPLENLDVAYPLSILSDVGAINDEQGGQALVVFHTGGTSSALGDQVIALAQDVGATGVFDPNVSGQRLTFARAAAEIVDLETGSTWNILGEAISGPLLGQRLNPIVHADHFWFSWAAFKPDTIIYTGDS